MKWRYIMNDQTKVYPSLLAADFGNIQKDVERCLSSGADGIHIDVMDGHFVKNLAFSQKTVAAVRKVVPQECDVDVHLMMYNPFEYIESFIENGAKRISFHIEATEGADEIIEYIKKSGCKAGIAINPSTSVELILKYLDMVDSLLVMGVEPGHGSQQFIPDVLNTVKIARAIAPREKLAIQVDGGIDSKTGAECVKCGANILVSGSYLLAGSAMPASIQKLRNKQ